MIITFKELNNQQYEVQSDKTDKIYNEVKEDILKIIEKYKNSNEDLIISTMAVGCIANELSQWFSDNYGAEKIIQMTNAKKI